MERVANRRLLVGAMVLLGTQALAPTATLAQVPDLGAVGEVVNDVLDQGVPVLEGQTGQDLTTEEIDISLDLDIRNAEFQLLGILFGGGKVETNMDAVVILSFRAVSVARLDEALAASTSDLNVSLERTFGINGSRLALTAEELRAAGGGAVLQAFQGYQEGATRLLILEKLPGIRILSLDFAWENVLPGERPREGDRPDLREPPIVLVAKAQLDFLDRFSIVDIVEAATSEDPSEDLQRRIEENQTVPLLQRTAFEVLGLSHLFSLDIPPGWRLNLSIAVPRGFTIEGATDVFIVHDHKDGASYYLDGAGRTQGFDAAGVVTLSTRALVSGVLLGAVLLVGLLLRAGAEAVAFRHKRKKGRTGAAGRSQPRDLQGEP